MHVVMPTVGTRGDVQPIVALGKGLAARGHRVTVATHADHESFVTEHGLGFRPIGGSFQALVESDLGRAWLESGDSLTRYLKATRAAFESVLPKWYADAGLACEDADVVVAHPFAIGAYHVAEQRNKPLITAALVPVEASGELEPMAFPKVPAWRWMRAWLSNLTGRTMSDLARPFLSGHREALGLPPLPKGNEWARLMRRAPILHLFSESVVPRPKDWPDHTHVTGFCYLPMDAYAPPPSLEEFLARGEAPLYVGFGSMTGRDPEQLTKLTMEALRRVKQRAVIVTGWGGLRPTDLGDDVYVARDVPHDWLFPRVRAAVHHGGAGTTSASLRAGKATLIVAFFGDQPFWGHRVRRIGAGPAPLLRRNLSAGSLAAAITKTLANDGYTTAADAIGEKLRAEDGVANAIAHIERAFSER
jgi:sterol 3beta-glucosyltransferase